jgi:hypothetical protein
MFSLINIAVVQKSSHTHFYIGQNRLAIDISSNGPIRALTKALFIFIFNIFYISILYLGFEKLQIWVPSAYCPMHPSNASLKRLIMHTEKLHYKHFVVSCQAYQVLNILPNTLEHS